MKLPDITAAIAASNVPAGYALSHHLDTDTGEHILRVDGPSAWYVEVMHIRQVPWLRKCVVANIAGGQNTDSAV